jgi:phage-related protein
MNTEKSISWVGSSYKDLLSFPLEAKQDAGYQLHRIQNGLDPENWKPFKTIGAGVKEIRINCEGNAFRIMYVTKFLGKIYVLHSFQKKSQKTRLQDIEIAKTRYNAIIKKEGKK